MATKREIKGFLIGTAAGAAIGAVAALLLAPKDGKSLRKDIAEGARKTVKAAGEAGEKAGRIAADLIDAAAVWRRKKKTETKPVEAAASSEGGADADGALKEEAV